MKKREKKLLFIKKNISLKNRNRRNFAEKLFFMSLYCLCLVRGENVAITFFLKL